MPVVFRLDGFRFFFYSNEGDPREPVHIHVEQGGDEAKFWLWPEVKIAYNDGFDTRVLRKLAIIIEKRRDVIEKAWHDFFCDS